MTDRVLWAAVEEAVAEAVRALSRRPSPEASSFALEELEAHTGGGRTVRLVLKDVAPAGLAGVGARAKAGGPLDPDREAVAYRQVLMPWGVDVPACLAHLADPATGGSRLLLEAVAGRPLWQEGAFGAWAAAARWLGDLHGRGAPPPSAHLLAYDDAHLHAVLAAALAGDHAAALPGVAAGWEQVVGRLRAWPRALVHGDFYASNVLVGPGLRVRPVDWELAGTGPGVLDLAALTAGGWTAGERRRMALAYHAAWGPAAARLPVPALLDVLEHARLVVAVGWLGRPAGWAPPPEHEQDWRATALDAAQRLGL